MSFDSRFPHLAQLDEVSLPTPVRRFALAVANRIFGRVCYNRETNSLHWFYGEPDRSPFALDVVQAGTVGGMTDDQAVAFINRGKMDRREKDRIVERGEKQQKDLARDRRRRFVHGHRPETKSLMEYRDRARRGVQKVFG